MTVFVCTSPASPAMIRPERKLRKVDESDGTPLLKSGLYL
jgi:hypothetical protein